MGRTQRANSDAAPFANGDGAQPLVRDLFADDGWAVSHPRPVIFHTQESVSFLSGQAQLALKPELRLIWWHAWKRREQRKRNMLFATNQKRDYSNRSCVLQLRHMPVTDKQNSRIWSCKNIRNLVLEFSKLASICWKQVGNRHVSMLTKWAFFVVVVHSTADVNIWQRFLFHVKGVVLPAMFIFYIATRHNKTFHM